MSSTFNTTAIMSDNLEKPYIRIEDTSVSCSAAFLPAINTTSQPVNWSRTVSPVVYTTGELGASRDFPNFDLHR